MPVTAVSVATELVARGLDPRDHGAKQSLYTGVIERHSMLRGRPPEHVWWVPGRLEVFGKHTDYAGGRTLVSPVSRGFAVAASARDDNVVQVVDAWRAESVLIPVHRSAAPHGGWRRYVEVAVHRLARNFPGASFGADIVIASDLPRASGMSSSSALVVAIAAALGKIGALPKHPAWKLNVRTGLDAAGYYACIENGSGFAALRGDAGVGTHGGSEDHAAIVEGRPRMVSAYAFVPARALGAERIPDEWRFVIAPSGVAARKTGEAREPYNRLSAGISRLLEAWNADGPRAISLAAALKAGPEAAARLRALAERAATPGMSAQWLRDRLEHFLHEDERPLQAMAAFAAKDERAIGELASASQADAERLLGNQVPATSALAGSARMLGAFAASSFGAGFGGAVWALVPSDEADHFAGKWHRDAFVMHGGLPLTDLSAQ